MKIFHQKNPTECIKGIDKIRRAAFDFGGGSIRVLVADVDVKTKEIEKLFSGQIAINFRLDLTKHPQSNEFSEDIQITAHAGMHYLLEIIAKYAPQQFSATATEAFRMADNGLTMLQSISHQSGVPILIIDQQEEGRLGFLSAITYSASDPQNTVVVDLGTGSVQITAQNSDGSLNTHGMKLGSVVIRNILSKEIRKLPSTLNDVNPIMKDEALALIHRLGAEFNDLPESLVKKLQSNKMRVISTCGVSKTPVIRFDSAWDLLQNKLLERKTGEGINAGCTVSGIFVYSLIHKFAIEECHLVNSNNEGNTSGMLLTDKFWPAMV